MSKQEIAYHFVVILQAAFCSLLGGVGVSSFQLSKCDAASFQSSDRGIANLDGNHARANDALFRAMSTRALQPWLEAQLQR